MQFVEFSCELPSKCPHFSMNPSELDIFAIGHCCVDLIYQVDAFLSDDGKTSSVATDIQAGGPAANAVVAAARLGARTAFAGQIGRDVFGDLVRYAFETEHVSFYPQYSTSQSRVASCIVHSTSGARQVYASTLPDATADFALRELIESCKVLLLDGHEAVNALPAAHAARSAGKRTVLGLGSFRAASMAFLPLCETVVISENFARSLAQNADDEWIPRSLERLKQHGMKYAIVTVGASGSIGFDGENIFRVPAVHIKAVDTTGAGDAYLGAIAYAHLHDWPLPKMMKFATFIAAEKCQRLGGRKGLPTQQIFSSPRFATFMR